jgi:hypothetical protein
MAIPVAFVRVVVKVNLSVRAAQCHLVQLGMPQTPHHTLQTNKQKGIERAFIFVTYRYPYRKMLMATGIYTPKY